MSAIQSGRSNAQWFNGFSQFFRLARKPVVMASLTLGALALFEVFNFSTTERALSDALGTLGFLGIRLATILALAFCVIDFSGVVRLFSQEDRQPREAMESWYLLAAWLLAGFMNAAMTWWAVTEALLRAPALGNELFSRADLLIYIPVFVAGAVWLIRILLIGSLTMAFFPSPTPSRDQTAAGGRSSLAAAGRQTTYASSRLTGDPSCKSERFPGRMHRLQNQD